MYKQLKLSPRHHGSGATFGQDPESLKYIYVKGANDTLVPLSAFTHYAPATTPLAVNHQGQFLPSPCRSISRPAWRLETRLLRSSVPCVNRCAKHHPR